MAVKKAPSRRAAFSMAHALELRVPFVDREVMRAALAGVAVELASKESGAADIVRARVTSNALGNFTLQLAPARQYRLTIAARGDYAGYRLEAFTASSAAALQNIVLERIKGIGSPLPQQL